MLNISEMSKILAYLLADSGRPLRKEKVLVWVDQFHHLKFEIAWAAAKYLNAKGFKEWEPRTQEFREAVAYVQQKSSDRISGDEAFSIAVAAVKRFGSYQEDAAMKSLAPAVAYALKRFGYKELCMSEEALHGVHRAQFARIYDASKGRTDFESSVKPQLAGDVLTAIPAVKKILEMAQPKKLEAA